MMPPLMCDFDNDAMTCPHCGFKAGGRDWNKNCKVRKTPGPHPGSHLARLIAMLSMVSTGGCKCGQMIRQMNAWGIVGCRLHRAEIAAHLERAYRELTWAEWARGVARATATGLALRINPLDKCGSLVDEAIRLAELAAADRL